MKAIMLVGAALLLVVGTQAHGEDQKWTTVKAPPGPPNVTIKLDAPADASEQEIAAGLAAEQAKHDPIAQQRAEAAKQKAAADEAHTARIRKICDSIPESSMRNDPSLRKMCQ